MKLLDYYKSNYAFKLWFIVFAYTMAVSFLIQLILLPHVFSSWHAGDGLLNSSLDSVGFHRLSVAMADKIKEYGWKEWSMFPATQPVGIVSAIYFFTVPKPWVIIPLNAMLHATSAVLIFLIIQIVIKEKKQALWCVLPFILYPTAALWYAQIHKNGFVIAGFLLVIYGWILIVKNNETQDWKPYIKAITYMVGGIVLMWLVRPFIVELTQQISFINALFLTAYCFVVSIRDMASLRMRACYLIIIWAIPIIVFSLSIKTLEKITKDELPVRESLMKVDASTVKTPKTEMPKTEMPKTEMPKTEMPKTEMPKTEMPKTEMPKTEMPKTEMPKTEMPKTEMPKNIVDWAVTKLELKINYILNVRNNYRLTGGKSLVDEDIILSNLRDVIFYLPRLIEVAFLSPFPYQWFEEGSYPATTVQRKITGLEMMGVYFSLLGLPYAIWRWRKKLELWIFLIFNGASLLFYAFVVMNIGTLHRQRYGSLMAFVALGMAGIIDLVNKLANKKQGMPN